MEIILFYLVAGVAIASAFFVVKCRNPINSALNLVTTFICLAVFYVMLESPFMAAIQIIVYAGAIMVLIIFVIMLLNFGQSNQGRYTHGLAAGGLVSVLLLFVASQFISRGDATGTGGAITSAVIADVGHTELIGRVLFLDFALPLEIAAVLLLIAIVGALIIAKQKV
jgi:NADH-quinone oxidoreductase subunit J